VYLVVRPEAVEHVLVRNHRNYRKPNFFNGPVGELVGQGLVTSEGEPWRAHRKLIQPAFHRDRLAGSGRRWSRPPRPCWTAGNRPGRRGSQTRDILPDMMRLTLQIASTTLFSADISGDADTIGGAFRTAFAHVSRRMNEPPFLPRWLPTRENRRFARAKGLLDCVVLDLIETRRQEGAGPGREREDLLSMLLAAQDEETGLGLTDAQLKDEVLTLLLAGHDTVGAALGWSWYLLGQHLDVQDRLTDEVRGRLGDRPPTMSDLAELPLTRAVSEEALRLYPPAPGLPREAIGPGEVDGFAIPRKPIVVLSQHVTHRHPEFWEERARFDPERFLPARAAGRPKFAYSPFGGGPRSCVGNQFALMEGTLVLAAIARRFRVELVPGQAIEPDTTFTLPPWVVVALRPR
jgi:cytochrome P450